MGDLVISDNLRQHLESNQSSLLNVVPVVNVFLRSVSIDTSKNHVINFTSVIQALEKCQIYCQATLSDLKNALYNEIGNINPCENDDTESIINQKIIEFIDIVRQFNEQNVETTEAFVEKSELASQLRVENNQLIAQIRQYENQLEIKQHELQILQEQNEALVQQEDCNNVLKKCQEDSRLTEQLLNNQIQVLEQKIQELVVANTENETAKDELRENKAVIEELTNIRVETDKKLSQLQIDLDLKDQELKQFESKESVNKKHILTLEQTVKEYERRIELFSAQIHELKTRCETLESDVENKQGLEIPDHSEEVENVLQQQVAELTAQLKKLEMEILSYKEASEQKEEELDSSARKCEEQKELTETLKLRIKELTSEKLELEQQVEIIKRNCNAVENLYKTTLHKVAEGKVDEDLAIEIAETITPDPWIIKQVSKACLTGQICSTENEIIQELSYSYNRSLPPGQISFSVVNPDIKPLNKIVLILRDGFKPNDPLSQDNEPASVFEITVNPEFFNDDNQQLPPQSIKIVLSPSANNGTLPTNWQFVGSERIVLFVSIADFNPEKNSKNKPIIFEALLEDSTSVSDDKTTKYIKHSVGLMMDVWTIKSQRIPDKVFKTPMSKPEEKQVEQPETEPESETPAKTVTPKVMRVQKPSSQIAWVETNPVVPPHLEFATESSDEGDLDVQFMEYHFQIPKLPTNVNAVDVLLNMSSIGKVKMNLCGQDQQHRLSLFKHYEQVVGTKTLRAGLLIRLRVYPFDARRGFPQENHTALKLEVTDSRGDTVTASNSSKASVVDVNLYLCQDSGIDQQFDSETTYLLGFTGITSDKDISFGTMVSFEPEARSQEPENIGQSIAETPKNGFIHHDTKTIVTHVGKKFTLALPLDGHNLDWDAYYPASLNLVKETQPYVEDNQQTMQTFSFRPRKAGIFVISCHKDDDFSPQQTLTLENYVVVVYASAEDLQKAKVYNVPLPTVQETAEVRHIAQKEKTLIVLGNKYHWILLRNQHNSQLQLTNTYVQPSKGGVSKTVWEYTNSISAGTALMCYYGINKETQTVAINTFVIRIDATLPVTFLKHPKEDTKYRQDEIDHVRGIHAGIQKAKPKQASKLAVRTPVDPKHKILPTINLKANVSEEFKIVLKKKSNMKRNWSLGALPPQVTVSKKKNNPEKTERTWSLISQLPGSFEWEFTATEITPKGKIQMIQPVKVVIKKPVTTGKIVRKQ